MEISPEQLRSLIQAEVRAAVTAETGKLQIQSGQNVNVSGAWPSFTVSATAPGTASIGKSSSQSNSGGGGAGAGTPIGDEGDLLYHDGTTWVVLAAPSAPGDPVDNPALRHDGTAPYWEEPDPC